jgi:hypothetical protein
MLAFNEGASGLPSPRLFPSFMRGGVFILSLVFIALNSFPL